MKKLAMIAGAGLLAFASAGTAEAQWAPRGHHWGYGHHGGPVVRERVVVRHAPVVRQRVVYRTAPVVRQRVVYRQPAYGTRYVVGHRPARERIVVRHGWRGDVFSTGAVGHHPGMRMHHRRMMD